MTQDTYLTIDKPSKGIYRDKGSKFIALAYPCSSENEAKEILASVKKEYYDAHHHCFAWQLGLNQENQRFSDDGEPSGTAGRPIFGQIRSKQLINVMVIVVRYFGGTKLGVRGLIDAYEGAASDALNQAEIIEKHVKYELKVRFAYELINEVMRAARELKLEIAGQEATEGMVTTFLVPPSVYSQATERFGKIFGVEIQP